MSVNIYNPTTQQLTRVAGAGEDGLGIKSVDINGSNHLIVTYDDDTMHDAGEIQGGGGESSDIPSYYQTEFATTKASVESHSTNDSYNVLFMTDLHFSPKGSGYNESVLRVPLFTTIKAAKKFAAEVPTTQFALGGDYMQMPTTHTKEMGISNLAEINETFDEMNTPFFPVAGNHEAHYTGNSTDVGLDANEVYQYLLKKWVGRDNVKKVSINTFYRIDDVNQVCHVFVSSFSSSSTKTAVLADFASVVSANTNNYPYIIYNHFGVDDDNDDVESYVKDCIDYIKTTLGKTIIAWISGHRHVDWVKAYHDTLVICLLNSGWYGSDKENQDEHSYSKTVNTSTESLFSVLTFVPTTGKVFITRFGAGVDMECNYNTTSGAVGRIGYLPPTSTYSVTNTLSGGVKNSNSDTTVSGGSTYNATLSVPDGRFTFGTVTVTMGSTDITSTAYNPTTHAIEIANVTGDIVITATATNNYVWSVVDSTINQYSNSKPCTFTANGNDLSMVIDKDNSGIKASIPVSGLQTGTEFTIKADAARITKQTSTEDKNLISVQIAINDSNNSAITTLSYITGSLNYAISDILDGITRSKSDDLTNAAYLVVMIRSVNSLASSELPITLEFENLRVITDHDQTFYWTPENATVAQHDSYRPATLSQVGNDIDLSITRTGSGVNLTKSVPTISPTGNVTFTIKADSVQWSSSDDSHTFTLKIYWLDSNGTTLTQKDIGYNQTFVDDYYDAIVNGLDTTILTSSFSDWASVKKVKVEMRAIGSLTESSVPASLFLTNFRIELKSA